MDALATKLGLKDKEDWYHVSIKTIRHHGGRAILSKYSESPKKLLTSVYPEYPTRHHSFCEAIQLKIPRSMSSV